MISLFPSLCLWNCQWCLSSPGATAGTNMLLRAATEGAQAPPNWVKTFGLLDETPFKWTTEHKTAREWVLALGWGVLDVKPPLTMSGGTSSEEHRHTACSHPSCPCWEQAEEGRGSSSSNLPVAHGNASSSYLSVLWNCFCFFPSWILAEKKM